MMSDLLRCDWRESNSSNRQKTHNLDGALAVLLDGQRERRLEAGLDVPQQQERLVRALGLAAVLGRQGDLGDAVAAERDGRCQRAFRIEPMVRQEPRRTEQRWGGGGEQRPALLFLHRGAAALSCHCYAGLVKRPGRGGLSHASCHQQQ